MVKNPPDNVGATGNRGSVPGMGRFPGGGNGNTLQYSWWGNPMDRGAWWVNPWGHKELKQELNTTKHACNILSNLLCFFCCKQDGRPPMSKLFWFCFVCLFIWLWWVLVTACKVFQHPCSGIFSFACGT